ncbi:MAG TPA: hypothetical protein VF092_24540 [Longimicrobium sp.]
MSEQDPSGPAGGRNASGQDHLDHLRKSHFFLVSAAGLLSIAVLSHEENRTLIAFEDAQQIASSAARFDSLPLASMIEGEMLRGAPERVLVSVCPEIPGEQRCMQAGLPVNELYVIDLDSTVFWTASPSPDSTTVISATPLVAPVHIRTLRDWKSLWEMLGYSTICRAGRNSDLAGHGRTSGDTLRRAVSLEKDTGAVGDGARRERYRGYYVISHLPGSSDYSLWLMFYDDVLPPGRTPWRDAPARHAHLFSLSCTRTSNLDSQDSASQLAGKQWKTGHFGESFRHLAGFTSGLEAVSVKTIADMLQKKQASGVRDVQVVGLPIPIGMLVEGGMLLILMLQLYFLLHLRAYEELPHRSHSIAWIGFYDDPASWLVYSASIFVLPVACGYILVQKALGREPGGGAPFYLVEFGLIVVLSLALLFRHPRRGRDARYRSFFRRVWRDTFLIAKKPASPAVDEPHAPPDQPSLSH